MPDLKCYIGDWRIVCILHVFGLLGQAVLLWIHVIITAVCATMDDLDEQTRLALMAEQEQEARRVLQHSS